MTKYQQIPKPAQCPVCHNGNAHILWSVNSKQAAQHYVLREKHPARFRQLASHIESLWGRETCEVVQCDGCGFCYSDPYIAGDEQFYTLAYVRTGHSGYPAWRWEFQLTHEVLSQSSGADVKLLEVGAGEGAFVRKIVDRIIPPQNITCTDFSEYGRHRIENLGVRCLANDVRNLTNPELKECFDVICMFQILEHMDTLDLLFQRLNWLMKQGGSLFISTPNPGRTEFNELHGGLLDMPPNHIGRWNKACFEIIGQRHGFHIADFKLEQSGFLTMSKQFVFYRMLRRSQQSGSLENRLLQTKNRYLHRMMQIIGMAVNAIAAIPALAMMPAGQGGAQWIHLIKAQESTSSRH